jgi:hypothetical protein
MIPTSPSVCIDERIGDERIGSRAGKRLPFGARGARQRKLSTNEPTKLSSLF